MPGSPAPHKKRDLQPDDAGVEGIRLVGQLSTCVKKIALDGGDNGGGDPAHEGRQAMQVVYAARVVQSPILNPRLQLVEADR